MSDWPSLLARPSGLVDGPAVVAWFDAIAERLLNGSLLYAGGEPHRFIECEFYYHGAEHYDAFTHRDDLQLTAGRWYFHRTNGVYRGGSFKGLDISFGDGTAHGGVLLRGLEISDGAIIDGPSLMVDHLLDRTGAATVAQLDKAIAGRPVWDEGSPLHLQWTDEVERRKLVRSGRVGLTLKKVKPTSDLPRFLLRPYRYLSLPERTAKGKAYLVLALYAGGHDVDEINRVTGCPKGTVRRYIEAFEEGRQTPDLAPFFGMELGPNELCRLHGVWYALHGEGGARKG